MSLPYQESYVALCVASPIAVIMCMVAWYNLICDVGRGYSPDRCALAAVLLLGASIIPVVGLVKAIAFLLE